MSTEEFPLCVWFELFLMMQPQSTPSPLAQYRAALSQLQTARVLACERHEAAQDGADPHAGAQNIRDLECALDAFKSFRRTLSPRDLLVCEYSIEPLGEHQVAVTLPAAMSPLEFLKRGDNFVREFYGYHAVWLDHDLATWIDDPCFLATHDEPRRIIADGCVDGTSDLIREDQEAVLGAKGLSPISLPDLAVAHMALQIATGEDLFLGKVIRTQETAMILNNLGLHTYHVEDWRKGDHTAMAARVG